MTGSVWADGFNGILAHPAQRDTAFVAVSRAPLEKLEARKARMGWTLPWVSGDDGFSDDFDASFRDEDLAAGTAHSNCAAKQGPAKDLPAASTFVCDDDSAIFHACSCCAPGLVILNPAYSLPDVTPLGRHGEGLLFPMGWIGRRDRYPA